MALGRIEDIILLCRCINIQKYWISVSDGLRNFMGLLSGFLLTLVIKTNCWFFVKSYSERIKAGDVWFRYDMISSINEWFT